MQEKNLNIVVAQINAWVGDIPGNCEKIMGYYQQACQQHQPDAVVFPELCLIGYPPEDLLLRRDLPKRIEDAIQRLCSVVQNTALIVGTPYWKNGQLLNAALVIIDGEVRHVACKQCLPNYSVFDEKRYFQAGDSSCVFELSGVRTGLMVCEDIWYPQPAQNAKQQQAELLITINASPFHMGRQVERFNILRTRITETGLPILYVNLVGGQDELVFDGRSFAMDNTGKVIQQASGFNEDMLRVSWQKQSQVWQPVTTDCALPEPYLEQCVYDALVLAVRDYVNKNGFKGAIIGLSGGIDSALTAAVAVDALGAGNVEVVMMPSRYTAAMSIEDARQEADYLEIKSQVISIEPAFKTFLESLQPAFTGMQPDTSEENIQARCRGVILMALSNKSGKIVLTTGNKSEMAVGYATLYGDMAGGFAVLKDVPKTLVYKLAEYRNRLSRVIPQRVLERPPSAELAPDQLDSDSLPEYPELDAILEMYVEQDMGVEDIIQTGHHKETIIKVLRMVDRNEYKRRQAAPGVRITRRAFSRDRRYPITSGYGNHY